MPNDHMHKLIIIIIIILCIVIIMLLINCENSYKFLQVMVFDFEFDHKLGKSVS